MTDTDRDVARLARGQEVSRAKEVLDEYCDSRRSSIIGKILKHIRNPDSGPLEAEMAIQSWLELDAIESMRRDLDKQVKEGERAGNRIDQAQ